MSKYIMGGANTDKCSPKYAGNTTTCFSKDALNKIAKAYNRKHKDKIPIGSAARSNSKKQIWYQIQDKLKAQCGNDETCWLEQSFLKSLVPQLEDFFKPMAPVGRYQWLTTDDIYNVMRQYEDKHKDFKFVGPVPMDFLHLSDPDSIYLQKLNLNTNRYRHIGIIFNLDPSNKPGSHWVGMHIDRQQKIISFFDSYGNKHPLKNAYNLQWTDSYGRQGNLRSGNLAARGGQQIPMPKEIQEFIHILQKRGGAQTYKIKVNTIQHQYANSECGIYSMMFILKRLKRSFEQITQDIITDEEANKKRGDFFRDFI